MNNLKKTTIDLIFQVSVVTDNMDKLLSNWKEIFDFDEKSIVIKTTEDAYKYDNWDGFNYNEKPCKFFNRFCRFNLGGIDFEIIEPMDKDARSPFSDFLFESGGSAMHHIGIKVGDMDALDRKMKEMGIPVLNHAEMGKVLSDGTRKNCTFYDLRKQLGLILECGSLVVGPMASDLRAGKLEDCKNKKSDGLLFGFERNKEKPAIDLLFQVCVCVSNLDKTLAYWKEIFDFDESTIVMKSTKKAFEEDDWDGLNYNEKRCGFFHRYARFAIGGLDLEIIEPMDKAAGNPYSDFLLEHGNGIHHFGVKVGNMEALNQKMRDMGIPRFNYAQMGPMLADGTRKACTFYDLRKQLGVILECGSVVVGPLASDARAGNPSDFVAD